MENETDNNEEIETINTGSSANDNSGVDSISNGQALKERVLKLVKIVKRGESVYYIKHHHLKIKLKEIIRRVLHRKVYFLSCF